MECRNGLCKVKTCIAETDLIREKTFYIERLFYEFNGWKALIEDLFRGYMTIPEDKAEELKKEYLISFMSYQIALQKSAMMHFKEYDISKYKIEAIFDENKIRIYEEGE